LSSKITFRPATLDSKTHKRLTAAIDKKHGSRATRTMEYVSRVDPEKEKEALDAELEKAARESAALLRKQQKMMKEDRERRYYETGGRAAVDVGYTEAYYERRGGSGDEGEDAAGARMDADFLEAEAEDAAAAEAPFGAPVADQEMNDDDDDEEDDVAAAEPTERKKRRMVDDEEEDE
jgi:RNA polymerase-associated protein LEO1